MFVVKHKDIFTMNTELNKINTCQKLDFCVPSVSLTKVQKGITLFKSLPHNIDEVAHYINKFKHKLRKFLIETPFNWLKSMLKGMEFYLGYPSTYSFVFLLIFISSLHVYILIVIYLMLRQSYVICQCNLLTVSISYVPEWIDE
jgi:hypothetical protein